MLDTYCWRCYCLTIGILRVDGTERTKLYKCSQYASHFGNGSQGAIDRIINANFYRCAAVMQIEFFFPGSVSVRPYVVTIVTKHAADNNCHVLLAV